MTASSPPYKRAGTRALAALAAGAIAVPISFGMMGTAFATGNYPGNETAVPPAALDTTQACPPSQVTNPGFTDISSDFFKVQIECLADYGVTHGTTSTTYSPANPVTREDMAQYFYNLGLQVTGNKWNTATPSPAYTDQSSIAASEVNAVNALTNAGIVSGFTDGSYRPQDLVTRGQMSKFIYNFDSKILGITNSAAGQDYFYDDDGSVFENPYLNGDAGAGVYVGTAGTNGGEVSLLNQSALRDQMAGFLSRVIQQGVTAGKIANKFPPSNQTYTVSPSTSATQNVNTSRQYSVSGLTSGSTYTVELFACSNITSGSSGTTFAGSNPGGSGNVAKQGTVTSDTITVINGSTAGTNGSTAASTTVAPSGTEYTFTASGTSATFTVQNSGTANCAQPVVYNDANSNGALDLNANGTPSEQFGLGGATNFVNAAPAGAVQSGPASNVTGTTFDQNNVTYTYGPNDQYQLQETSNGVTSCVTDSYSDFQSRLTNGDTVTGSYVPTGVSTFCLNDTQPTPPGTVTTYANNSANTVSGNTATGAGQGGITVQFTDSANTDVVSYNVYRAQATTPTTIGGVYTCPTYTAPASGVSPQTPPTSPYTVVGTVTDTSTPSTTTTGGSGQTYYYNDTSVAPATGTTTTNQYCYIVSSNEPNAAGTNQTGTGTQSGSNGTGGTGPAAVPTTSAVSFATLTQSAANKYVATYNTAINTATCDGDTTDTTNQTANPLVYDYSAYYTNPNLVGNQILTITGVTCSATGGSYTPSGGSTVTGVGTATITTQQSVPSGSTVYVTSQTGSDGNTVCAQNSTTNCQPTGQTVQTTSSTAGTPAVTNVTAPNTSTIDTTWNEPVNFVGTPSTDVAVIAAGGTCGTSPAIATGASETGDGTSILTFTTNTALSSATSYILCIAPGAVQDAATGTFSNSQVSAPFTTP